MPQMEGGNLGLSGILCIAAALMVLFIGAGRGRREPEGVTAAAQ